MSRTGKEMNFSDFLLRLLKLVEVSQFRFQKILEIWIVIDLPIHLFCGFVS